jgi:cysteine-rich repeat protein
VVQQRDDASRVRRATAPALLAIAAMLLRAATVQAHNIAADLSVWGNFGTATAQCQRAIGEAAALCTSRVLAIRTACLGAQLRGDTCDTAASEARVQSARAHALATVQVTCTPAELQTLRYIDLSDAQNDVINVCRTLDTAAVSAAYGPATFGGTVSAVDGSKQACLSVTGRAAAHLLRFAMRTRRLALDEIATVPMSLDKKTWLLRRSLRMITAATALTKTRILTACSEAQFEDAYGRAIDDFLGRIGGRADCLAQSVYVQNAVTCPASVCGDGMQTPPEECDDGNSYDGDGCRSDCTKTNCDVFPTTYDLIQKAIFENHHCTDDTCHGSAMSGGLDLRAGASYANLVDVAAQSVRDFKRIDPGSEKTSLLWVNLAARTLPAQYTAPLRGMPIGLDPISTDELEALRLWIVTGGAARDANLPDAANLLKACVPAPQPVKIDPLAPPAPGTGVQMHMPAWTLAPHSESEVCFSTYYDLSDQVPPQFLSPDGQHFRYKSVDIRQDPISHHLIVDIYRGSEAADDPVWGVYKCRSGERDGQVCDPLDLTFCGAGQCATDPDPTAIACIGFGPQTGLSTLTRGGFAFAQATTARYRFPQDVYDELPLRGVVLWNSHAFNLTDKAGSLEAWVNLLFPAADEEIYRQTQVFNVSKIFWSDFNNLFPLKTLGTFDDMEICNIHEFGPTPPFGGSAVAADETAHLFELSGHTHQHGVRFQVLRGRFTCSAGPNAGVPCNPFEPELCPAAACVDDGGRDPQQALLYTNYVYNDPVVVRFDDAPILISGSAPLQDRTLTYCAHYDNGKAPNIEKVKRRSTSPPAGTLFGTLSIGGPCDVSATRCIGGPHHDELCNGDNTFCASSPDGTDGDCDACPLTGGFRTQDEMFVLFGNYWVTKN